MRKKLLSLLVLLMVAVTGAWAEDTYNVTLSANGNTKVVENVTLPHTFSCYYNGSIGVGDGELDLIIQELYGFSGGWCDESSPWMDNAVSGVTVGISSDNQYFSISTPFEGTAQLKGWYYRGWEDDFEYTLDIAIASPEPAEPEAQENVTIIFNNLGLANQYDLTTVPLTVGNIELNFAQNNGLNPPRYYTTDGGAARIYMGTSMSISAGGATITKIVFNLTQGTPTFDTGSYNATTKTWEGEATTLTLSNEMASGQVRITSMDVYYSVASAAGEATYTVTLKEGTADADKWAIAPAEATTTGVAQGTEITLTYSGTKRVKSVKAVKKPEPKPAAEATAEDLGKVIGADGKIYADVAAATAAGTTAVAKIIYIGTTGHATYSHGLALALTDEASKMAWEAAIDACSAKNTSTPVTGATWLLASKDQWDYMMGANGAGSYADLRSASNLQWNYYWSSTENDSDSSRAWYYYFASGVWLNVLKGSNNYVRACLAF